MPFGHDLAADGFDIRDYARIYTEITTSSGSNSPSLWVFLIIVLAALGVILVLMSLMMRWIQRKHRAALRRRVARGEVDLEALGIKRLTVPEERIKQLPLFIYVCEYGLDDAVTTQAGLHKSSPADDESHEGSIHISLPDSREPNNINNTSDSSTTETIVADQAIPCGDLQRHSYTAGSQPTCPICLEDFVSGTTVIRALPCTHIYHPECIDTFLSRNSSLCPMCKKSVLPLGYCPTTITNAMARRERNVRRVRERVIESAEYWDSEPQRNWRDWLGNIHSIRTLNSTLGPETAAVVPAQGVELGRREIAPQRAAELLDPQPASVEEAQRIREDQLPRWRKGLERLFPGFM